MRKRPMMEHHVIVRVSEGVNVTVSVFAPPRMPLWKLTRMAAIKLDLIDKPPKKRRSHKKHAIQRRETIQSKV